MVMVTSKTELSPLDVDGLIQLFNQLFGPRYQTVLTHARKDPQYVPSPSPQRIPHRVEFAHGFFASALHEISHWCLAGPDRRQHYDYGYWYNPDGRSDHQQRAFLQVEAPPQALEWLMTVASGRLFHLSFDNLSGDDPPDPEVVSHFQHRVRTWALAFLDLGLPTRASLLITHLQRLNRSAAEFAAFGDRLRTGELPPG